MLAIEYRAQYTGKVDGGRGALVRDGSPEFEVFSVRARTINAGYRRALARALEPLGNGSRREVGGLVFWRVVDGAVTPRYAVGDRVTAEVAEGRWRPATVIGAKDRRDGSTYYRLSVRGWHGTPHLTAKRLRPAVD